MSRAGRPAVLENLRGVFEGRAVAGLGEGSLLDRFVEDRDELAFAALLSRHGPMVLGVCRRILSDPRDVEDAFQATFLVFARRAGTLVDRDRLAPWLFGVARKVATRARRDLGRRSALERPGDPDQLESRPADPDQADLGRVLVEEIGRLPESLKAPILLCCGEGLSYDEAAIRLDSTVPAVRGRLSRARIRLRDRLTRRGFAPGVLLPGAWPWAARFSEAVPTVLFSSTCRLAIPFVAGRSATLGLVPASVSLLAEGAIRTMIASKLKWAASAVIAVGLATGVGAIGQQPTSPASPPVPPPTTQPEPPTPTATPVNPADPFLAYYQHYATKAAADTQRQAVETDRLAGLEAKLDRLIQALERPAAPPGSRPSWATQYDINMPPQPPQPPQPYATLSRPAKAPKSVEDRLAEVERKVAGFGDRLAAIERRLAAMPEPTEASPDFDGDPIPPPRPTRSSRRTAPPRPEGDIEIPILEDRGAIGLPKPGQSQRSTREPAKTEPDPASAPPIPGMSS